jgi:hypothetical protein
MRLNLNYQKMSPFQVLHTRGNNTYNFMTFNKNIKKSFYQLSNEIKVNNLFEQREWMYKNLDFYKMSLK